jgi:hypothetical protein
MNVHQDYVNYFIKTYPNTNIEDIYNLFLEIQTNKDYSFNKNLCDEYILYLNK